MLCQNCGKNEATTHIKRIVNGESTQMHLCGACAEHLGYGSLFSGFGLNLSSILQSFFPEHLMIGAPEEEERCPTCGTTFPEIIHTGNMGCADCYNTFYEKLKPSLSRIHGRASHVGKVGAFVSEGTDIQDQILSLNKEMEEAIASQNFERAAEIRDLLKDLKGGAANE